MSKQDLGCTLSNEELIKKAEQWIRKLIDSGGRDWELRIPAEPNHDPDIIFSELCKRLSSLSAGGMRGWIKASDKLPPEGKDCNLKIDNMPFSGRFWEANSDPITKKAFRHFNVAGKTI